MRPPRPILALYATDVLLGILAAGSYFVTSALGIGRVDFFRLGVESNLPSWYSASQLLLVALVFGLLGWRDARWSSPRTWAAALPGLGFLLLSLDEGGMLHERAGDWLRRTSGAGADLITGPWLFVAVPLYVLLAVFVARSLWPYVAGRRKVIVLGALGSALLLVSAAGIEALGNLTAPENEMARRILGVFEEVGEMVAVTTLLWSGLALTRAEGFRIVAPPRGTAAAASPPALPVRPVRPPWTSAAEAPTPEAPTPEAPTPEAPTPEAPTPEAPTPEAPTPEAPTPEAPTPEAPTPEAPTPEAPTPEAPTPETAGA